MATARVAQANRELVARNLTNPGDNERDLADRLVGTVDFLLPRGNEFLLYAFRANLLEQIKRDVIGAADLVTGGIGGVVERTVCFADLVEFTSLGEEIAPEELGVVIGHFEELATEVIAPPVRLVKTIGDAVMLISPEAAPLVGQALDLVAAAAAEGDQFPVLRAGLATGPTLPQSGDYYGRSVNLASRITGIARPGSVLVDTSTREAAGEGHFEYSFAGERRLKGIDARSETIPRARRGRAGGRRVTDGTSQVSRDANELSHGAPAASPLATRRRGGDGGDQLRSGRHRVPQPRHGRRGDRRLPRPDAQALGGARLRPLGGRGRARARSPAD